MRPSTEVWGPLGREKGHLWAGVEALWRGDYNQAWKRVGLTVGGTLEVSQGWRVCVCPQE